MNVVLPISLRPNPVPVKKVAPVRPAVESLSIVIPIFNGATTIGGLTDALVESNPGYSLQVVLVNDGSADASRTVCRLLAGRYPEVVTFVDLARNVGEHNAVMAGLSRAVGDYCVIMDDDFQNPAIEAYRLADKAVRERFDIVFSSYAQKRHGWIRNLGSRAVNAMARRLMRLPDGLYLSSFKCLSRFAVEQVVAYRGPFPYVDGLALRATRNIGVLPTAHEWSRKDRSGYTVGKLLRLWGSMMVNFSILPLRLGTLLGVLFSILGLAGSVYVVLEKMANPQLPIGWPSLIVAVLLLSGIQLLILGVIGEYLGQMVLTINGTPQYIVREVVEERNGPDEG
jgi:undecaprenyl-phosphate 4-deoxy-4-formamido-L-arabinose transferase